MTIADILFNVFTSLLFLVAPFLVAFVILVIIVVLGVGAVWILASIVSFAYEHPIVGGTCADGTTGST